jgi:pyridoxal phosphate-dependent aminotransferase EpsN
MDPARLAEALESRARRGRPPRAIIVADIYGQCADWDAIEAVARAHGVPVIEDAAEAVGATFAGRPAGGFGAAGVYSFNGNKILNTGGGGMLLSADAALVDRARSLSTQAREPAHHYEHLELGYNYRMSNVLAAIGRGQLRSLGQRIARKHEILAYYRRGLGDLPGVRFMPELARGASNHWLTCLTLDPQAAAVTRDGLLGALWAANIEARPLWKPLHRQPLFRTAECFGGGVAERLFAAGLCLPSGSAMTEAELERVVEVVRGCFPSS